MHPVFQCSTFQDTPGSPFYMSALTFPPWSPHKMAWSRSL